MAWHDDGIALAVWAAYGGARALGLTMDEEPPVTIDRLRRNGYGWADTVDELGIAPSMRRELAEAAAFAGMARWSTARRDQAIREAVEGGCTLRPLGEATGLSHGAIALIAKA